MIPRTLRPTLLGLARHAHRHQGYTMMIEPGDRQRCSQLNRNGQPCQASPLKGKQVCAAHDPTLPDTTRFGSPVQAGMAGKLGGAATRHPRVPEVMREQIEARLDDVLAPHFRALTSAVVIAQHQGQVFASDVPDLGARIAATERLLDRAYGRPRPATAETGVDGGRMSLELPEVTMEAVHDFLRRVRDG